MALNDLINGGLGILYMVIKEARDNSRRHREMAASTRELAAKVGATAGLQTLEAPLQSPRNYSILGRV